MKKVLSFLLMLLCILIFTISLAAAEREPFIVFELPEKEIITEAKLPESLITIEDEAFEGTALVKVELPETVTEVGERAFANIPALREVKIPLATKYIANTAFDGSYRTRITAPANSNARTYARTQGLPFSPIIMFCATTHVPSGSAPYVNKSTEVVGTERKSDFKPETQWRRIEEQNITRTEELIANHVQGRSPPRT